MASQATCPLVLRRSSERRCWLKMWLPLRSKLSSYCLSTSTMPKGRPPRPTKLQVELRGDPSKRRGNTIEPDAPKGWPDCPQHVQDDPIAYEEWKSICSQLESMDLLSTIDGRSIELYVLTYSRFRASQEQVKKHGDVLLLGKNKYPQVSPFYTTMNRYHDDCRKWLIEFGLTPAARARLRITVDKQKTNGKWSGILPVVG